MEIFYTKVIGFAYANLIMVLLAPLLNTELRGLNRVLQIVKQMKIIPTLQIVYFLNVDSGYI